MEEKKFYTEEEINADVEKLKKATELGVQILSEEEFHQMLDLNQKTHYDEMK